MAMLVLKSQPTAGILKVLSSWTATFVFIAMFRKIYPQENLWDFIRRRFREKVRVPMLLYVILVQIIVFAGSLYVRQVVWHVPVNEQLITSWTALLTVFGYNFILGPLGEELGWRGFVLNELLQRFSPLKSAIIVGVIWGLWHTPLWLMSGYSGMKLVLYIVCFLIAILSVSIIITVLYNLNRNLMVPILIHQLFNYLMAIQTGEQLHILSVTALFYGIVALGLGSVHYKRRVAEH